MMGRLKPWHNLPPVLQCNSKYKRLSDSSSLNLLLNDQDDDVAEISVDESFDDILTDKKDKKRKRKKSGGIKRSKKKDCSRQLIQDSFQELMSYSCGQCGHVQTLQAEELKSILGHAFRLAYAAHLQKAAGIHPPTASIPVSSTPRFSHKTNSHNSNTSKDTTLLSSSSFSHKNHLHGGYSSTTSNSNNSSNCNNSNSSNSSGNSFHNSTSNSSSNDFSQDKLENKRSSQQFSFHTHTNQRPCDQSCCLINSENGNGDVGNRHGKMRPPASLPTQQTEQQSQRLNRLSPDSSASNNSTDSNASQRLHGKLSSFKDLPPLEEAPLPPTSFKDDTLPSSNLITDGVDVVDGRIKAPSTSNCCSSSGLMSSSDLLESSSNSLQTSSLHTPSSNQSSVGFNTSSQSPIHSNNNKSPIHSNQTIQSPHHSSHSPHSSLHSTQSSLVSNHSAIHCPSPPPLPQRSDSLTSVDEPHLKAAAWFQAGIPREIALDILGQEPQGAFLVRESSSKPGCYALSLRVPTDFAAAGIAHYLIVRSSRGYRIKGFTKEFPTLRTLITHHSVMPELLPVPLLLTRHNPAFKTDEDGKDGNEEDPDYNTLSDFRKMMADLNV